MHAKLRHCHSHGRRALIEASKMHEAEPSAHSLRQAYQKRICLPTLLALNLQQSDFTRHLGQKISKTGILRSVLYCVAVSSSFVHFPHCLPIFSFPSSLSRFLSGVSNIHFSSWSPHSFFLHLPSCVFSSSSPSLSPHSFYPAPQYPTPSLKYLSPLTRFSFSPSYFFIMFHHARLYRFKSYL